MGNGNSKSLLSDVSSLSSSSVNNDSNNNLDFTNHLLQHHNNNNNSTKTKMRNGFSTSSSSSTTTPGTNNSHHPNSHKVKKESSNGTNGNGNLALASPSSHHSSLGNGNGGGGGYSTSGSDKEQHHINSSSSSSSSNKTHIKKPLNAFMIYMKEMRAKVIAESTLKESAAINQILGKRVSVLSGQSVHRRMVTFHFPQQWHELSRSEQEKYYEQARKERQVTLDQLYEYRRRLKLNIVCFDHFCFMSHSLHLDHINPPLTTTGRCTWNCIPDGVPKTIMQ